MIIDKTDNDTHLINEERNLLSTAYKHITGVKRQSWRIMCCLELTAETQNDPKAHLVKQYRERIEGELEKTCLEIIELIDNYLLKVAVNKETLMPGKFMNQKELF